MHLSLYRHQMLERIYLSTIIATMVYIANFNRHLQLPLIDAVNSRILVWNEPMCESSSFEYVTMPLVETQ